MKFRLEIYLDTQGQHRWRFVAANGKEVMDCSEGYNNLGDMLAEWENIVRAIKNDQWQHREFHQEQVSGEHGL